jgi:hypothetical protein
MGNSCGVKKQKCIILSFQFDICMFFSFFLFFPFPFFFMLEALDSPHLLVTGVLFLGHTGRPKSLNWSITPQQGTECRSCCLTRCYASVAWK